MAPILNSPRSWQPALRLLALALAVPLVLSPAAARAQVDDVTRCLADSTTGKERKALARWLFISMASHPELNSMAAPSEQAVDEASRAMGALLMRVVTQACTREFQAVSRAQGPQAAIRIAFENLGQLAMMEVMSNREVAATVSRFGRYIDKPRIDAVLEPGPGR